MTQTLHATCKCGRELSVTSEFAGKRVKCPACGAAVEMPRPAGTKRVAMCRNHPDQRALGRCNGCAAPVCDACRVEFHNFCGEACRAAQKAEPKAIVGRETVATQEKAKRRAKSRWIVHAIAAAAVVVAVAAFFLLRGRGGPAHAEWTAAIDAKYVRAVIATGDRVYVLGDGLWEHDPATGQKTATLRVPDEQDWWQTVGLAGDVLVEAGGSGLRGFSLSKKAVAWTLDGVELARSFDDLSWGRGVEPIERVHVLRGEELVAIDGATGREAWKAPMGGAEVTALHAAQGRVAAIVPMKRKHELALFADGKRAWSVAAPDAGAGVRLLVTRKGVLVVAIEEIAMHALDDGRKLWSIEYPDYGKPALPAVRDVGDDLLFAASAAMTRVEAATGRAVWFAKGPESFAGWDAVGPKLVIAGSTSHHLVDGLKDAVLPAGQDLRKQLMHEESASSMMFRTVVYMMDPATGRTEWVRASAGGGVEPMGDAVLVFGPDAPKLYELMIDPHKVAGSPPGGERSEEKQTVRMLEPDGSVRWEYDVSGSTTNFVRVGERVIFGAEKTLVALRVR